MDKSTLKFYDEVPYRSGLNHNEYLTTSVDKLFPLPGTLSVYTARDICDIIQARFPDKDIWMVRIF
jgi:hypothetical protein